jgi:hypothetical protein
MCRLLGLTAGSEPVHATFWLLDAPDSLEVQSRRNVDGSGIGFFGPTGAPVLDKQPEAAFRDEEFVQEAKRAESAVFVAHVRWATAGGRTLQNTHPFTMQGRIMAHNEASLCQEPFRVFFGAGAGRSCERRFGGVVGLLPGPGVAWPKSRCAGCEPAALATESFPVCPPGPFTLDAAVPCRASAWRRAKMASLILRLRDRSASLCVLPSATLRS